MRVKRRRGLRRGPWRCVAYRRWIASHPCVVCEHPDTQAAHTVNNGRSSKGPDSTCVPLCIPGARGHHAEFDAGRARFDQKHGVDMYQVSQQFWAIWCERKKAA